MREPALAGPRPADPDAADSQERSWLAYAWPIAADDGAMMYAIDQSGQVYAQPYLGEPPAWNGMFGDGGTWGDEPAWAVMQETQVLDPEVQQAIDQAVFEAEADAMVEPEAEVDPSAVP